MKPLTDKKYKLEKYPGKGGWTYARIPGIGKNKGPFGYVRVKGTIDGYEISKYNLMPMSDGNMFLPVKAEIRKKIGKQQGDWVHVILYADNDPLVVPQELLLCLEDEPKALKFFNSLTQSQQKYYTDWIYSALKQETRIERLATTINRLREGLKMHDIVNE